MKFQKMASCGMALLLLIGCTACRGCTGEYTPPDESAPETTAVMTMEEAATTEPETTEQPETTSVSVEETIVTETETTAEVPTEAPTQAPTLPSAGDIVPVGYLHCVLELDPYTEVDDSRISIVYPQLDSDTADAKAINDLILGKVQKVVEFADAQAEDFAAEGMDTSCSVHCTKYEIARDDADYLSIVWYGDYFVEMAAHPNNYLDAIIIDKATLTEVTLSDLYTVDDAFSETLKAETADALEEWGQAYLPEDDEMTLNYVRSSMDTEWLLASNKVFDIGTDAYLSEEGLVLALSGMPHAMGDYMEVTVPYEAIAAYQK